MRYAIYNIYIYNIMVLLCTQICVVYIDIDNETVHSTYTYI